MRTIGAAIAALALAAGAPAWVRADEPPTRIRAVTSHVEPFVMDRGGHLDGFAIDVWNEVAARLHLETTYEVVPRVTGLFDALRDGRADIAVECVFYTLERDRDFDFSFPILNTGLQVMVRDAGEGLDHPLKRFLAVLFTHGMFLWLLGALLLVLLPAHVLWWLERRHADGAIPAHPYIPGIFHAIAWAAEALVGWAAKMPRHGLARVLGILWLYVGVVFVAVLTASLTANMTVQGVRGAVHGPDDLGGKKVGVVAGTTSVEFARGAGARVQPYPDGDALYAALEEGQVDAVVWGGAMLRYYESHEGLGKVKTVGPEVHKTDMGFVVPLDSPLRRRVSTAIVAMREDGTYERIHAKWFGAD